MDIKDLLEKQIHSGELSNDQMVELIELIQAYLNLRPLIGFCKENKITYQGILKSKRFQVVTVLGKKFVIDNK